MQLCGSLSIFLALPFFGLPLWLSCQRIHLQCGRSGFDIWIGKIPWRKERLPIPVLWPGEFHGLYSPRCHKESDMTERLSLSLWFILVAKMVESACNMGDQGSIPGSGSSPGEGNGNLLQYLCLENPMDGGAWQTTYHGVAKSQT